MSLVAWPLMGTGGLPVGWSECRVSELVTLSNGFPFDSDGFDSDGDLPLVRIRDLRSPEFSAYVSGAVPRAVVLQRDDIVIGMDGDFDVVLWTREAAALNQRLCLLRPRTGVDARFVFYALPRHLQVVNDLTYATTVKHLSSFDILSQRLPCPPSERQRAIADYLDVETARIDRLSRRRTDLVERLHERRAATIMAGVAGMMLGARRKSSSLPWLSDVPAGWSEIKLTLIARLGSGHTPSRRHEEWWTDCSIPWITTGEVWQLRDDKIEYLTETRERISELGLANSAAELCPAGTVVLSRTASAGFSAIMGTEMATSQDFMTWQCGPRLRPRYLLLCLRAMRADLLERLAMGSTHQTIYVPDIQSVRIPVPPVDEQDLVVDWVWERLRHIDAAIEVIDRQVDLLVERRQALITAAVTGQIEIPGVAA